MRTRLAVLLPFAALLAVTGCASSASTEDANAGSAAVVNGADPSATEATLASLLKDQSDVAFSIARTATTPATVDHWNYRTADAGFSISVATADNTETFRAVFALTGNTVNGVALSERRDPAEVQAILQAAHADYQAAAAAVPDVPAVDVPTEVAPQAHILAAGGSYCDSAGKADDALAAFLLTAGFVTIGYSSWTGWGAIGGGVMVLASFVVQQSATEQRDWCAGRY